MDHSIYLYSPLPRRPAVQWPGGARLAFSVFVYLEYWELDPPEGSVRDRRFSEMSGYFFPDYRTYSWHEYGNRVGIFRILDALDRHGIRATVALNGEAARRYPYLVAEFLKRGYEVAAHGTHATRMISSAMGEDEEQSYIAGAIDAIAGATGTRPRGWIGQDYGESTRTPFLLARQGIDYLVDWPNDDQPYPMSTEPSIVSLPNQAEWDDVQLHWHRRMPMKRYPEIVGEAFDTLWEEGAVSGRFFGLHIHPWLLGMPHRIAFLEAALARICARDGVWQATASEVVAHFREHSIRNA